MAALSDEQKLNAMKYGLCRVCKQPREAEMLWTTTDEGQEICTHGLVCPNGHEQ